MIKNFLFLFLVLNLLVGCSIDGVRVLQVIKNADFMQGSGTNIPYWTNTKTPFWIPGPGRIRAESSHENTNVIEYSLYQEFLIDFNVESAILKWLNGTMTVWRGNIIQGYIEVIANIQKPDNSLHQIYYLKIEEEGYHFVPDVYDLDITEAFDQLGHYKLWINSNLRASEDSEYGINFNRIIIYGQYTPLYINIEAPTKKRMIFEQAESKESLSWARVKKTLEQAEASESLSYQILPYKRFFKDSTEIAESKESLQAKIKSGIYERDIKITDKTKWQEINKEITEWEEIEKKETEWE